MTTRDRVILLILFVGFMTFVFEVRYEHRYVIKSHWEGWIPIVYSALAALACLVGMAKSKWGRTAAALVFFLGFIVSGVGLYKHTQFRPVAFEKFFFPDRDLFETVNGQRRAVVLSQPLAAPLGILGLASVGFILSSGLFKGGRSS